MINDKLESSFISENDFVRLGVGCQDDQFVDEFARIYEKNLTRELRQGNKYIFIDKFEKTILNELNIFGIPGVKLYLTFKYNLYKNKPNVVRISGESLKKIKLTKREEIAKAVDLINEHRFLEVEVTYCNITPTHYEFTILRKSDLNRKNLYEKQTLFNKIYNIKGLIEEEKLEIKKYDKLIESAIEMGTMSREVNESNGVSFDDIIEELE